MSFLSALQQGSGYQGNQWLQMMNNEPNEWWNRGAMNTADQYLANLAGMQQHSAAQLAAHMQQAWNPHPVDPERHTAKELTAFALAWVFGDEQVAPLLATEAAGASRGLRAPSRLDMVRNYQGQPTLDQVIFHRIHLVMAKPWFWPVFAAVTLFDAFSWLHR